MNNKIHKHKKAITGLHILGEIYTKNVESLKAMNKIRDDISKIVKKNEQNNFKYKSISGNIIL